jgi:hypothetical protein
MRAVAGLSSGELVRVRSRLEEFAGEMFESMRRKDQRRWGECYLRGLMLDGKRKSIEPFAVRFDSRCGPSAVPIPRTSPNPCEYRPATPSVFAAFQPYSRDSADLRNIGDSTPNSPSARSFRD